MECLLLMVSFSLDEAVISGLQGEELFANRNCEFMEVFCIFAVECYIACVLGKISVLLQFSIPLKEPFVNLTVLPKLPQSFSKH